MELFFIQRSMADLFNRCVYAPKGLPASSIVNQKSSILLPIFKIIAENRITTHD